MTNRADASADLTALVRPERVGALLAGALNDPHWRDLQVRLISGGKSNLTFELTSEAGAVILRRPPSGTLLPRAHDMGREVRIQRALVASAVPVPQILLAETTPETLDVPFYVMRKVTGYVLRDEMVPGYADSPADRVMVTDALVDTLARLHALDPAALGLADFGRPENFLKRQLARWSDQWARSRREPVPEVDELAGRLSVRLPDTTTSSIVHGDYRLDNCLMSADSPARIAAVLDWELSTLGDPLADLGLLLFYWHEAGDPKPLLTPALTGSPGFPTRDYVANRYACQRDVDLTQLPTYVAFAAFKFAVIAAGIAARVADGQMAGQNFGDLRAEITRIATSRLAQLDRTP